MKKILSVLLILCLCFSLMPISALQASAASVDDLTFELNEDETSYCVYGCSKNASGELVIPETYDGKPVTSIGDYAFYQCSKLTGVTIPNSVTSIGSSAFSYCEGLIEITIPDGVTSIGSSAFRYCYGLTEIIISNSVTIIGSSAFYGCRSLKSMVIPFVGGSASATSASSSTLFGYIFGTSSYTGGTSTKQYYGSSSYSTYYIPTSLKSVTVTGGNLYYGAFNNCSNLTNVTIGDGVTSIGSTAFCYCYGLTEITIPNSVTSIGSYAFRNCNGLTNVTIPNSVTSIGSYAFYWCNSLISVTIPNSVTSIGNYAFDCCSEFNKVYYMGSQSDRESISFGNNNGGLTAATWYYNSCIGTDVHTYDDCYDLSCNICEKQRETNHSYQWVVDKEPTCVATGLKHEECSICQVKRNENTVIDATGNHSYQWVVDKESGCGSTGLKHEECSVCQVKRNENTVIEATGNHTYEWIVDKESGCGSTGLKHEECLVCNAKHNENTVIEATGNHTFEWIIDREPTCGAIGLKHEECSVCNTKRNENTVIDATGNHTYEWIVDKEPTCGNIGLKHEKCTICQVKRNENTVIAATGNHVYKCVINKATTSKNGSIVKKCDFCGISTKTTINYAKTFKLSATSYIYSGGAKKPAVKIYDSAGKLIDAKNYTVSYKNNKKVGKASVVITFKNYYSGKKTVYFTINPKATKLSKVTGAKKSLKVSIKKQSSQVTGYQVQYSTSKKFTSAKTKTISSYKTTSYTIKSLKAKKTYYVRVRTYKVVNGKKYYSGWSTYKSAKTK